MITKEQALALTRNEYIHYKGCKVETGPRGGKKYTVERYRVASQVKTWVTRPDEFRFTVKHGVKSRTYEVDNVNAMFFHLASECEIEGLRY